MLELVAIAVLVLANGFFALAEFSVVASRTSRLAQKKADGKMGASRAEKLRQKPERFLASIQVGITLVGALLGVFSGATIMTSLETWLRESSIAFISDSATSLAMAIVVVTITVLSVVIGELVPKYIALSFPERYARLLAGPISFFITATAPFSRLLSNIATLLVRMMGIKRQSMQSQVTEDEINQMLIEGRRRGVFEQTEQQFIRSVFEFTDSTVRRALTPRPDVVAIEKSFSPQKILGIIKENGYSRYPVYEKSIDHVIGIIYTKDLIVEGIELEHLKLSQLIREPVFVPDSMPLQRLLKEFQKGKNHLAIVLDEYGGTAGVITLEDVLEELVGEIQDEYDTEAAPLVKHSETTAFANGDVWPGDVNEMLETHLPEDDIDTLVGLLMETTGRLPEKDESIQVADVRITILVKDENRILRLRLDKVPKRSKDE